MRGAFIEMRSKKRGGGPAASSRLKWLALTLPALLILMPACENSDPVAPEGSIINVSADPQTVQPGVKSLITATVRGSNGTRLPEQEVLSSTTQGTLDPPAQTSIITDKNGQATSTRRSAANATVTARSGSISASTSVNVVNCNLTNLTIEFANPSQVPLSSCANGVDFIVRALDNSNNGCGGVSVEMFSDPPTGAGLVEMMGTFIPSSGTTDAAGEFRSRFTPNATCPTDCGSPNDCEAEVYASDSGAAFFSNSLTLSENVN